MAKISRMLPDSTAVTPANAVMIATISSTMRAQLRPRYMKIAKIKRSSAPMATEINPTLGADARTAAVYSAASDVTSWPPETPRQAALTETTNPEISHPAGCGDKYTYQ